MHPALAFEISEHAHQLVSRYAWLNCEPVILRQQTDGFLSGGSQPVSINDRSDVAPAAGDGLPDGTVMSMVDVLCELSRKHQVDWDIGHNHDPFAIGRICNGIAESDLLEQLETLDDISVPLEGLDDEADGFRAAEFGRRHDRSAAEPLDDESDDDGPRLLKFPVRDG